MFRTMPFSRPDPYRWNCPAAEPSQGSHCSRPRSAQVCEAGQAPLRARAGAVLRDPQEKHPEIQQLHLSHRVTGRPLWTPPAGVGNISIRVLVGGWEGVTMWGTGHGFYIYNYRALISCLFFFSHFAHFFLLILCTLTWPVLSRSFMSTKTCRSVRFRAGTEITQLIILSKWVTYTVCQGDACFSTDKEWSLHFCEFTKRDDELKSCLRTAGGSESTFLCSLTVVCLSFISWVCVCVCVRCHLSVKSDLRHTDLCSL